MPLVFSVATTEYSSAVNRAPVSPSELNESRLHIKRLAADCLRHAVHYRNARDRHITSHPDILGGTPVITGTRITVYAVLGRLQGGDSVDDLVEDYPEVPREAFMAAELYAKAHPLRGRPSDRPWRQAN